MSRTGRCWRILAAPSLHFKKNGRFWSVRIGIHYRALALEYADNVVWFWNGTPNMIE